MPKARKKFDEKQLTKGELRKLSALRKSLGNEIAEKAFSEWYETRPTNGGAEVDKNAEQIVHALQPLIDDNSLRIPRGGYIVRRGRGRVIVEQPGE
jgi:hypothetical protein